MSYSRQTYTNDPSKVSGGLTATTEINAERANYTEQGVQDASNRLDTLESAPPPVGSAGPPGPLLIPFGDLDDTTAVHTGDVWGPWVATRAYTVLPDMAPVHRGGAVAGETDYDVEHSTTGRSGPWTSIFTTGKPKIIGGSDVGSNSSPPTTTGVAKGDMLRVKCLSAPTGGGALTRRTPATAGDLATGAATVSGSPGINIPICSDIVTGDLMVSWLFCAASTVTWPAGWTPYGAPLPIGDPTSGSTYYLHMATKTAATPESTSQTVSLGATSAAVMITNGYLAGSIDSVTATESGTTNVAGTTGAQTPAGVVTTVAASLAVHFVAVRHSNTAGTPGQAGTFSWSNSLPADAQSASNRAAGAGPNFAIATTHETIAAVGAVTQRTGFWAAATGRYVTATAIIKPGGGATPTGFEMDVYVQAV